MRDELNETMVCNDEGLLTEGELEGAAGGGVLKFIFKRVLGGPVGIIIDLLDAKPAY
jgi:hypothetical protein